MTDSLSPQDRSALMRKVKAKHTQPEMSVRSIAHGLGFRHRLHVKGLPGKPDLVFPSKNKVIFVHGCFWHRHEGCRKASTPTTNVDFWNTKFENNIARDRMNEQLLKAAGWEALTIWECETRKTDQLAIKIRSFLASTDA